MNAKSGTNGVCRTVEAISNHVSIRQDEVEFNLELAGGPFASLLRVPEDSPLADVRAIELRGFLQSNGSGEASILLDRTERRFNHFGDALVDGEIREETIAVELNRVQAMRRDEDDTRVLCEILPTMDLDCRLFLVYSPGNRQRHRIIIASSDTDPLRGDRGVMDFIALRSVSMDDTDRPTDEPTRDGQAIDVSSDPVMTGRGYMDFRIEGELGGQAEFYLDPNRKSATVMGDAGMSTLLGWTPTPVRLEEQDEEDPRSEGRRRYEIIGQGPRMVQYFLVDSDKEGVNRLVIMREGKVEFVVGLQNSLP